MTGYIVLQDILEHLFKFGNIEKSLLKHIRVGERTTIKNIIENGVKRNVLKENDSKIYLLNPLELIIMLEELGIDTLRLCDYISWSEFEDFIAKKLYEFGWEYILGYIHTRVSRFQIDVIALDSILRRALVIECKHWRKHMGVGSLRRIALNHLLRIDKLIKYCEWVATDIPKLRNVETVIPAVIVLRRGDVKAVEGVPIVPLYHLNDFLSNISSYLDVLNIKVFKNRCYI
ncbi:MAG: restriction endonuclease [Ignisphaera sp.]|uniref:Restriction endonuclease type IV Mrr domain-containing protein n=1 Tax=Ignisphaera aggregans TaxID=334771 RepID=A0A7J3I966_9CREN